MTTAAAGGGGRFAAVGHPTAITPVAGGPATSPLHGGQPSPSPLMDGGDGERLLANGQSEPSAAGESCGFGLGRLPRSGATAATAEGANFGAAEAAANGEQGAEGVEAGAIVRLSRCVPPAQQRGGEQLESFRLLCQK